MFRIKTDIRQYKCESREKVERLIRNWVVRPTDLIFDDDAQEWQPIGEHSIFATTFAEMADQESQDADTVVSPHPPAGMEEDAKDEQAQSEDHDGADAGTQASGGADVDGRAADETVDTSAEAGQSGSFDPSADQPEPPERPEGLEEHSGDADEITVMTERTLDRVLEDEELESEGAERSEVSETSATGEALRETRRETMNPAVEAATGTTSPEAETADINFEEDQPAARTLIEESSESLAPSGSEAAESPVDEDSGGGDAEEGVDGSKDVEFEDTEPAAERPSDLRETDEDEEPAVEDKEASDDQGQGREETPSGRHDLPEDIFATNEIAGSVKREDVETIDELGEGDEQEGSEETEADFEDDEDFDYHQVEDALQRESRQHREAHEDEEEWDEIMDRLRETDELSKQELDEITRTRDQINIGRDEAEDDDVPEEAVEYVSEGYGKELPIRIGPTRMDIKVGLTRSEASEAEKDAVFPYPEPKRKDEVLRRVFRLRPPKDHSLKFIVGVVGLVLVLIVTAVFMF